MTDKQPLILPEYRAKLTLLRVVMDAFAERYGRTYGVAPIKDGRHFSLYVYKAPFFSRRGLRIQPKSFRGKFDTMNPDMKELEFAFKRVSSNTRKNRNTPLRAPTEQGDDNVTEQ